MRDKGRVFSSSKNRRAFLKNGIVAAGAATVGAAILDNGLSAFGKEHEGPEERPSKPGTR